MMDSDVMDIGAVAKWLGGSPRWVQQLIRAGEIPSAKIGGKRVFSREKLQTWWEKRMGGGEDGKPGK